MLIFKVMIGTIDVVNSIKNFFQTTVRNPAPLISAIVMICGLAKRPGLSCILSTSNVIQDLSKMGIPTDDMPDGSPNLMNKMVHSMICEIYRALKEDTNLQVALEPGAITIQAQGANAGGPVVTVGTNINFVKGVALLQ
jgi:hypothetical protein